MNRTLLLIDLSGIYWANWHATADQEVSAAFEFTVRKVNAMREMYTLCAICCDAPPYKRKELLPTYKAQRDAPPALAIEQLRRTKQRLEADGFLLWSVKGYEADDIIATAAKHAVADGLSVTIASGDKDLLQLVDDAKNVRVWSPMSDTKYKREDVVAKFGVAPEMMADLLALMGDTSDNVPGIPGVGVKKAAKLLLEHGDMQGVFSAVMSFTPALQDAILTHADAARLARKIVALVDDVPIDWKQIYEERKAKPLANDTSDYEGFDEHNDHPDDIPISPPPKPAEVPKPNGDGAPATPAPAAANGNGAPPLEGELEEKQTTAIVPVQPAEWSLELEPRTIRGALTLARGLHNSRLYQKFPNPESIMAVIIRGREMGLGALTALDCFHIVEGKPFISAHLIVAKAKEDPDCEYFRFIGGDATFAEYVTKNRNNPEPTKLKYTIQQAKEAGLCNPPRDGKQPGNWLKRPAEMLRKTCAAQLTRIEYPGAALGLTSIEEIGAEVA